MPFLSHLASLALMGATSHTVGLACASESTNPESQTVTRIASVSQVIRDLQWLGFDPIYPSFKGLTTFILVNPETGEPKAAVGISPEYMQNDHTTPLREDPPDNPETQALRITLGWHGANVYWLPHR